MKRDDNILEENDVFVSKRYRKPTDNTREDIQKLGCTVEFVSSMDKGKEALINSLSDHLSSWHQFSIELMKNIFQIISLDGLLRIEKLQKFLNELGCYINFQRSNFDGFINYKLQEKLINSLEMWPSWIDFILGLYTSFREG